MARNWLEAASSLGKNLAVVVAIVSSLSVIAGTAWSLFEFANATRAKSRSARIAQLTTYESFGELLKRYHEIEQKTDDFTRRHRRADWNFAALLKQYETGASVYYSDAFKDFRAIHQFYEELGTVIRFGAVDFELVFQLITFPSDFQEATRPLQQFLQDHWFELRADPKERQLRDFGFNLAELEKNYEARRHSKPVRWTLP
jgi:hypothetical protein